MFGRIGIAKPFVSNSDTSRECQLAVDDEKLAMGAMIDVRDAAPPLKDIEQGNGMISDDLHAGLLHL